MAETALFPPSVELGALYIPAPAGVSLDSLAVLRDLVSDSVSDYVCFQYNENECILILSDSLTYENGTFSADSFVAYDLMTVSGGQVVNRNISGRLVGVGDSPEVLNFSGQFEDFEESPALFSLFYDSFDSSIMISNSQNAILYSSVDGFARLHDSAAHYGFYISFVLSLFGVSSLIWSIFKKVK